MAKIRKEVKEKYIESEPVRQPITETIETNYMPYAVSVMTVSMAKTCFCSLDSLQAHRVSSIAMHIVRAMAFVKSFDFFIYPNSPLGRIILSKPVYHITLQKKTEKYNNYLFRISTATRYCFIACST